MNLRQARRALRSKTWVLEVGEEMPAATECQRRRRREAVTAARVYLQGEMTIDAMGSAIGKTGERAAQLIRLGITWLMEAGWLHPKAAGSAASARRKPRS